MRVCIPTQSKEGLEAPVYGHFGSAPFFLIYDTDGQSVEIIDNQHGHHQHGQCTPLAALGEREVHAVVTGGIGGRALAILNLAGIKAYQAGSERRVCDVLRSLQSGALPEISPENACGHQHGCH
jgi:predicted Fe-Mo cluster-binding NifX family protein